MISTRLSQRLWKVASKLTPSYQTRSLTVHDYQAQDILRTYGIPIPRGQVVRTAKEAHRAAQELGPVCMIKAQVLGGARCAGEIGNGFKGGVQTVCSPEQAEDIASRMLNQRLTTKDGESSSCAVDKLYVTTKAVDYDDNWYLALTIDRENYCPTVQISRKGGIEFEVLLKKFPEKLYSFNFSLSEGISNSLIQDMETKLGTTGQETENLGHIVKQMYNIFRELDATHLEINPLGQSLDGSFTSLNANLSFDDAAYRRQPELFTLRDKTQEVQDEVEAEEHGLVYVRMDGDIGNVVNGAGLAMATNDAIGLHGGASANFLDAGGKATKETMIQAFRIIARDERVKAILVNIYGGLTRCDMIAESIIDATSELNIKVPMVVRLQGTNSEKGLRMLEKANLGLIVESDLGQAAKKVVEVAKH